MKDVELYAKVRYAVRIEGLSERAAGPAAPDRFLAQAMRAILLASATATTLNGLRANNAVTLSINAAFAVEFPTGA